MAPNEEIEDRGRGAKAPRQPMRKRSTSSLERQQNLSCIEEVEDDAGRLVVAKVFVLLPPDGSAFLSHFPLYRIEKRLLIPLQTELLGTRSRFTPSFIISRASINLVQE